MLWLSTTEGVPGVVGGAPEGKEIVVAPKGLVPKLESGSENPNRETTTMKRNYERKDRPDKAGLRDLLAKDGREHLLPLVNVFALAGSLREGLDELFTVSRIGLTPALRRCFGTTNVIDNAHSGMRRRTGRVTRWRNGSMAARWAAAVFLEAETSYRRIMGYRDLWILKAHLDGLTTPPPLREKRSPLSMNRPGATATSNYGGTLSFLEAAA